MATMTDSDRSLGTIVKELTESFSRLLRSEIALFKWELKDTAIKLASGSGLFVAAGFVALCGVAFLFVTFVLGLVALGVPPWLSALIVALVLFAAAGLLAWMGKKRFEATEFMPTRSVEQIKGDIEVLKGDIERIRSR
jgi:Flp pilus assembly protein TadB